jgi:XTP/dITP diphosphohydrolase
VKRASAEWVVATTNLGKLAEMRAILEPPLRLRASTELAIEAPAETGCSFVENALLKARHAAAVSGLPSLADDSGLLVDALGGEPGLRSARFAGAHASDAENVALLLERLRDVPLERRGARFYCVVVGLRWAEDPCPLVATGQWHGRISLESSGPGGFGYDPVFFDVALGATAAELGPTVKNQVSHRARALSRLARLLDEP